MTLPFAFISDRYGRTIVLTLNTTGLVLMWISIVGVGWFKDLFPVELIALAPLFTILGGECVFMSTVSSVIADLAPEQKLRTHLFSYTASVGYVTILAGPGLAAFMMSFNLWVPFSVGIALLLASYPLIAMLPGGGCLSPSEDAIDEQTALLPTNESSEDASIHTRSTTSDASFVTATYSYMTGLFRPITQNPKFLLLTSVFFLAGFASSNSPLLVQYISKRYGWTFSQAGYLLSAKAIVNVLLLTIIIPSLIQYINAHLAISPRDINIGAAELSLIISVIGVLTIALAQNMGSLIPGLIIYALGSALPVFTMSLVKSEGTSASDNTIARDYSTVELAKRLGFLFGVPFMTYVWAKGIGSGGIALGLPYFTSAVSLTANFQIRVSLCVTGILFCCYCFRVGTTEIDHI